MTRTLCYDLSFVEAPAAQARLVVRLALGNVAPARRAGHAREMVRSIPIDTLRPALTWFNAMAGLSGAPVADLNGGDIIIRLSAASAARWQVTILLNLIDFAVGESDKDVQLISAVQVFAPGAGKWTFPAMIEDLRARMLTARETLTERLPRTTFIDQYTAGAWPEDAWYYTFALTWTLDQPLTMDAMEALFALLEDLELVVAWMGFALSGDAEGWEDAGKMVFPGEMRVGPKAVYWDAERPPSDIAFACLWIERVLEQVHLREVAGFRADISPLEG